jgi:hypothetical protein
MGQTNDRNCGICCKAEEHTKDIVVGCTTLASAEYTLRHNKAAGYIHWAICKQMGLQVTDNTMNRYLEMS